MGAFGVFYFRYYRHLLFRTASFASLIGCNSKLCLFSRTETGHRQTSEHPLTFCSLRTPFPIGVCVCVCACICIFTQMADCFAGAKTLHRTGMRRCLAGASTSETNGYFPATVVLPESLCPLILQCKTISTDCASHFDSVALFLSLS